MIRLIHIVPERLRRRIEHAGLRGYKREAGVMPRRRNPKGFDIAR